MSHSNHNPLVTLHDSRGRIVFAQPLFQLSAAEVIFSQPWDWVNTEIERDEIRMAFQKVLFDRESIVIRAVFYFGNEPMLYECTAVPVETDDITVMATSVPIAQSYNSLTPREIECLRLLVGGKHTASIAKNMGVKSTTINTYKQRIKEKLGIDTLAGLIAWGCKHLR
ncbi:MAG: helix-turn-helix transcriptional regulator [Planctomycetaceae bacterium]|jgi:DNA-binding CsgD family transcriptional regulator|nr:helix-turn-helix transcriptional regulator [Planctomycetaceae bacterium]MBT4725114.1 helix-turn-helix transcriptional regulator [Planctomycetaceae bacterium]MBT4844484.1 helix-turn-helix transcriptional regulator [Planctomycetaceae bacterium]MBT5124034.1 helix-turn-helix transcriptional regulator [Planctomycetaceae bacterium]MBT5597575.1 helix-turn-helix transcriptional regulator [Planctomycetaceae bacterium]